MKIRADFVTNSSSSSYVDIYADNPVLNQLLEKYNGSIDDSYEHFTTDYCNEHEDLEYSESLLEFLRMVAGTHNAGLREELEGKKAELLQGFRYAKYNTGYHYTDGYLSGEEHHITLSSRWGVVDQHTYIDEDKDHDDEGEEYEDDEAYDEESEEFEEDEDEYDDDEADEDLENDEDAYETQVPNRFRGGGDWEYVETEIKEKPIELTAGFEGARPEDLKNNPGISERIKLVLDNLSEETVEFKDKKFVFIGDYDQYLRVASDNTPEDEEEECWDEWDDNDRDPWEDREDSYVINQNIPETGLISLWLSRLGGRIRSIGASGKIGDVDYVVVRLDSWAEECIDLNVIREAVKAGVPIISEYRLWKAIFG